MLLILVFFTIFSVMFKIHIKYSKHILKTQWYLKIRKLQNSKNLKSKGNFYGNLAWALEQRFGDRTLHR